MGATFLDILSQLSLLLDPSLWLLLGIAMVALCLARRWRAFAEAIVFTEIGLFLLFGLIPIGDPILSSLEEVYPPNPELSHVDGIIVLGGAEDAYHTRMHGLAHFYGGAERFMDAYLLSKRFPDAKIIFTGWDAEAGGSAQHMSVAEKYFRDRDVSPSRLVLELRAKNTVENALFTFKAVQPSTNQIWVLVTSAFHMPRAMQAFKDAGWLNIVPYPVDFQAVAFSDALGWNFQRNIEMFYFAARQKFANAIVKLYATRS